MGWLGHFYYWIVIFLMMTGFYAVIARGSMIKIIIGLNIFQTSVFILFISAGKIIGASAPVLEEGVDLYSNPLPHVLILTAIVVGVATTAVGVGLVVRVRENYGSIQDDQLTEEDDGEPGT